VSTPPPSPGHGTSVLQLTRFRFRHVAAHVHRLVHWQGFEISVGIIIFLNAVLIGVDLAFASQGRDRGALDILDAVFLGIYTCELALRVLADGRKCFDDSWVKFDAALLCVGWSSELLRKLGTVWDTLGPLIVIRVLRFMRFIRFFRAARMAGRWKTLWKLVSGVAGSMETLISTFIVLAFAVYIFTCLSMELISLDPYLQEDPRTEPTIQQYFGSFSDTVMTTVQFVLMDSAGSIYRPLIQARWWLAFYFPLIFAILPILLMNLVTAVLVEDAISNSNMDEQMKREETKRKIKDLVPRLQQAFQILDKDRNGQVQKEEILNATYEAMPALADIAHLLTRQTLADLFDFFDTDGSGRISEHEFVHGVMQLSLSESLSDPSIEIAEVKHLALANARSVRAVKDGVEKLVMQLEGGTSKVQAAPHSKATPHSSTSG